MSASHDFDLSETLEPSEWQLTQLAREVASLKSTLHNTRVELEQPSQRDRVVLKKRLRRGWNLVKLIARPWTFGVTRFVAEAVSSSLSLFYRFKTEPFKP